MRLVWFFLVKISFFNEQRKLRKSLLGKIQTIFDRKLLSWFIFSFLCCRVRSVFFLVKISFLTNRKLRKRFLGVKKTNNFQQEIAVGNLTNGRQHDKCSRWATYGGAIKNVSRKKSVKDLHSPRREFPRKMFATLFLTIYFFNQNQ